MKAPIVVREYARLTTAKVDGGNTLDEAQVSKTAFDWLCGLAEGFRSSGASLLQIGGRSWLKLDHFVGVLESPCGQVIEILPKHHDGADCIEKSRKLLCKMIAVSPNLKARDTREAGLELYKAPLSEWIIRQFLDALDHLIKRGLRFNYLRVEEEARFLRGQLDVAKQLRQLPGKQHLFQIRHDVFLPDRPENRLLKSALDLVCQRTQEPSNWRLAHKLAGLLHELPTSRRIEQDFKLWRKDRLMAHYQAIKPWCELILRQQIPKAVKGDWRGISFLFPMGKLFERYVEVALRRQFPNMTLSAQVRSESLCWHESGGFFQLKPDLILESGTKKWVMDTKWKLLNGADRTNKYDLSQSDFYQLFAYGQKYLAGSGELLLIYPMWDKFSKALPLFDFGKGLTLQVVPFDLETEQLLWNTSI